MSIKAIISFFILTSFSFATEMTIRNERHYYKVTFNKKRIMIESLKMDLSLEKKKCNTHLFDHFYNRLQKISQIMPKSSNAPLPLTITVDDKTFITSSKSRKARTLIAIPAEFHRIKIEEKINCQSKSI